MAVSRPSIIVASVAVILCSTVAYIAVPWALFWALASIATGIVLGGVTAATVVAAGVLAALSFGAATVVWIIIAGRTPPTTCDVSVLEALNDDLLPDSTRASSHGAHDESDCASLEADIHSSPSSHRSIYTSAHTGSSPASERDFSLDHCDSCEFFTDRSTPLQSCDGVVTHTCDRDTTATATDASTGDADSAVLPAAAADYLDFDAMEAAAPIALLGRGRYGVVELVRVRLPAGGQGPGGQARGRSPSQRAEAGSHVLLARKTLRPRSVLLDTVFQTEVAALQASADSPFTPRYRGSRQLADRLELFTDYASGGTVEQEVADGMRQLPRQDRCAPLPLMPLRRLAAVARSALLALECLHAQGIAHLGVAPARLMLTDTGRLQLGGLSHAASVDATGPLPRPPEQGLCTAPELRAALCAAERIPPLSSSASSYYGHATHVRTHTSAHNRYQAHDHNHRHVEAGWLCEEEEVEVEGAAVASPVEGAISTKADIYSVGAVVLQCALWQGHPGALAAYQEGRAALPGWLPPQVADFVRATMAEEPGERPTAAEALAHPFLAGVGAEGVPL